jgi:hypothetical protein
LCTIASYSSYGFSLITCKLAFTFKHFPMHDKPIKSSNVLRIYDRLRQSPVTLDVLYDWVQKNGISVSRRTLYRYLHTLAGSISFPGEKVVVYDNEFNKKVWKIEYDESTTLLNQFDINTYYLLRNFTPHSLSGPRQESIKKLDTLMYSLASKSRFQLNVDANNLAFVRSNYFDAHYTAEQHALLEDLIWAIQHHRKIKVDDYDWDRAMLPEGFDNGMMVYPLKMLFHFGLLYICVYSPDTERIIILPFHELLSISVTNFSFSASPYYKQLEDYLCSTFGIIPSMGEEVHDIEIEFAGHSGSYVKTMNWHCSQKFENLPNGNILMRLRCGINRELVGFIVFFMNNARVIKPARLKQELVKRLQMMIGNYQNDNDLVYKSSLKQNAAELEVAD